MTEVGVSDCYLGLLEGISSAQLSYADKPISG